MNDAVELIALVAETAGRVRVRLTGRSMRPLLRSGMVVDVERLTAPARRGDILVYRSRRGLTAHRLVGRRAGAFLTCGDAHPDRLDTISPAAVIGRAAAVWSGDGPAARRIDGLPFRFAGHVLARTRPLRAAYLRLAGRLTVAVAAPASVAPPAAFRALVRSTLAFEGGDLRAGVTALTDVPLADVLGTVKRHHASGLVARWLEAAAAAGVPVPAATAEAFLRVRWTNALQADRVLARVRDVATRCAAAGIDAIVLKGGARLAAGEPDADTQFSGDVDVLVPAAEAERAVALFHGAGYGERLAPSRIAYYARRLHQRAPLHPAGSGVPVEVHVALSIPASVSQPLTYADLAPFARTVKGAEGEVRVLDSVTSALHLAYHARDLRVWRDVVLLARKVRAFSPAEGERFAWFVARERRDRVRLETVVAVARRLAGDRAPLSGPQQRYFEWALEREDMPPLLRRRAHILEALHARCPQHYAGLGGSARQLRGWLYNLALLPSLVRYVRWAKKRYGRQEFS